MFVRLVPDRCCLLVGRAIGRGGKPQPFLQPPRQWWAPPGCPPPSRTLRIKWRVTNRGTKTQQINWKFENVRLKSWFYQMLDSILQYCGHLETCWAPLLCLFVCSDLLRDCLTNVWTHLCSSVEDFLRDLVSRILQCLFLFSRLVSIKDSIFFLPQPIETMSKVKILFNSSRPVTTPVLNEILHREKVNVSKTYFNKYNQLFMLFNSSDGLDTLFSSGCIWELEAVGCKPILPPDLKAKRLLLLQRCDDQILNQRKENIKSEIEKQNNCVTVQEIFKYKSSKNIMVTFESQHMASQVLTKRLLLFTLSDPARNIWKEIFVEILICFKCHQFEIPHIIMPKVKGL